MKRYMNYWYTLSIRRKLVLYFFIIALFGAIINVNIQNNHTKVMDQFDQNLSNYHTINRLIVATQENQMAIDGYLKTMRKDQKDLYFETQQEINDLRTVLESRSSSIEVYFTLNAIKYATEAYFEKWDHSIEQREQGEPEYFLDYYEGRRIYDYTVSYVQELLFNGLNEGVQLYNDLKLNSESVANLSHLIIIATFVLSIVFGSLFSNYIIAPIKKLVESSIKISRGQLDVEVLEVKSNDEVGVLSDSFNIMSTSIKNLVEDLKQKALMEKQLHEDEIKLLRTEQLLQEAEFLALQLQINPHFLFNTLNTISRTAMFENAEDTIQLIGSLSNILRSRLRNTGKSISLKEELDIVSDYIHIQETRFKDRLKFIINCSVPIDDIQVPVFLIQPLVENSIVHGIEPKIDGGIVRIKIYQTKREIVIKILDTGIGISKEKLNVLCHSSESIPTQNIGVQNVCSRFKMFYDNKGRFKIRSKEGCGTLIILAIPAEWRDHV